MFTSFVENISVFPDISEYRLDTFSVAISDVDGNGLPDLFLNNHSKRAQSLYIQNELGLFSDIASTFARDFHGAFWADFDGDGELELLQTVGGAYGIAKDEARFSNVLFEYSGGSLVFAPDALGLEMPLARARQVVPYDFDGDGVLDVFHGSLRRSDGFQSSTVLMGTDDGAYVSDPDALDADISRTWAIMPGRFEDGDGIQFLGWHGWSNIDYFSTSSDTSSSGLFGPSRVVEAGHRIDDLVVEDFNGDLISDAVFVSGASDTNDVTLASETDIRFQLRYDGAPSSSAEDGLWFEFETEGSFTLSLRKQTADGPAPVYIGGQSLAADSITMTLDPNDPSVLGRPAILDTSSEGVIGVWLDPETGRWRVELGGGDGFRIIGTIDSTDAITAMETSSLPEVETYTSLLLSDGKGGFDETRLPVTDPIIALAAGDFDNDGDVDLFGLATTSVQKLENVFFINDGSGNFSVVRGDELAAGDTNGVGASAWTVDLNRDGWLDVFTASNQRDTSPSPIGSYEYFQNSGGKNSWLLLDVSAANSALAYGSIIEASSASGVQMRVFDGGVRHLGQEDPIVHFGLGTDDVMESLRITWRDGKSTVEREIPVNTQVAVWRGDDGDDQHIGSDALDIMYGSRGSDHLSGGLGNDRLQGDAGADELHGGEGDDTLRGRWGDDLLFGEAGRDLLIGGRGIDRLYGGGGRDRLYGLDDDDLLVGNAGDDGLWGARGRDRLFGGVGEDRLYGGNGNDVLHGGEGTDRIIGGSGRDWLFGDDGDDSLFGRSGADVLHDGAGSDEMTGGEGADLFVLAARDGSTDFILDFEDGLDRIDLRAWDVEYADLTVSEAEDGSLVVQIAGEELVVSSSTMTMTAADLTAEDFLF